VLDAAAVEQLSQRTGLSLERRPEELSPDQFISLSRALRMADRPLRHVEEEQA
jgi:hypothetical protein